MGIKENCTQWIDLAYEWLGWVRTEKRQYYLRESTQNIVERLKNAAANPARAEEAWNILERLKRLAHNFNNLDDVSTVEEYMYEPSEIMIECALVAYRMEDLQEALSLFKNLIGVGGFRVRSLHRAISYWLYGCVQWQSQSHLEEALLSWEKSLQITKEVENDNNTDRVMATKCREIHEQMSDAIRYASINNSPPPVNQTPRPSRAKGKNRSSKLMIFPVYGRIPAGPAAWVPPDPDGLSEVASVTLNDKEYKVHSLRHELTINIQSGRMYFLLGVIGDSMNKAEPAPIENGDLVLMMKQETAMNGDIIAAEIINVDATATLKRYRYKDGAHRLEPETTNPDLPTHISMNKDFHIRGIALAVLKVQ